MKTRLVITELFTENTKRKSEISVQSDFVYITEFGPKLQKIFSK